MYHTLDIIQHMDAFMLTRHLFCVMRLRILTNDVCVFSSVNILPLNLRGLMS